MESPLLSPSLTLLHHHHHHQQQQHQQHQQHQQVLPLNAASKYDFVKVRILFLETLSHLDVEEKTTSNSSLFLSPTEKKKKEERPLPSLSLSLTTKRR